MNNRTDVSELTRFAHELVDGINLRLLNWFGKTRPGIKHDGSVVTEADLEVDQYIHDQIRTSFPDHAVLSEENSLVFEGALYTWVVDPLDGTTNFANGLVYWGTSVALLFEGKPLLGILDFPILQQRFSALEGQGAWLNGESLQVSVPPEIHGNLVITMDTRGNRFVDIGLSLKPRLLGSAAYDMVAVAAGIAVASIQITPKIWDISAAWLVAREAGCTVAPLWPGATVFPLLKGCDYETQMYPLIVAPDGDTWNTLKESVSLRPGNDGLIEALSEQGWLAGARGE
ncbi:MAG: inositol monophosphatase family protein [Chloroflexota bacterium]|nr:inositol monophosphatase family protein [Chloroflexota bacterium]